ARSETHVWLRAEEDCGLRMRPTSDRVGSGVPIRIRCRSHLVPRKPLTSLRIDRDDCDAGARPLTAVRAPKRAVAHQHQVRTASLVLNGWLGAHQPELHLEAVEERLRSVDDVASD